MILRQFFEPGLAQYAYLVGCADTGDALLIDPLADIDQYQRVAAAEGLRIKVVADTHVHADFVSGALALAAATGATLYVSGEGDPRWRVGYLGAPGVRALHHGERFDVGRIRIDVRHTPGHTPEHLAFVVTDTAATPSPLGIFSGDLLFVGDVGRPDLLEQVAGERNSMHAAAGQLFRSLQSLGDLPERTLVWPAHGSGSACGKSLGGVPVTSLGYERLTNRGLAPQSEEMFVAAVLAEQPDPPLYFGEMKRLNRAGGAPWHDRALPEIRAGARLDGSLVVDVRAGDAAIPDGALAVPWGRQFHAWAGSVVPADTPLVVLADDEATAQMASRALALIGRPDTRGWLTPAAAAQAMPMHTIDTLMDLSSTRQIVDVRSTAEWHAGHLAEAVHVPLARLGERLSTLDLSRPMIVYCQAGTRARVAAAALQRAGATVAALAGGLDGYRRRHAERTAR